MVRAFRRDRRAISPVIATIIIVAVAIVMSIAVAYWMMGLATTFTRYEKLEYTAAYAVREPNGWNIKITVKNTGSAPATITNILFNGYPYTEIGNNNTNNTMVDVSSESGSFDPDNNQFITVNPGQSVKLDIRISSSASFGATTAASGLALEITIVTAAGNQYPKTIVLP